ncbi:haloacid dehalogenase type II [Dictyobacter kobayashii]|uniref:Haloacid dehalogenase n=1 Tax=Dictyobacter kobayashii TaxID=2014872 RepID=A0A402AXC1_9CHLR|nr:haloacid dehalogenase type II [Dictyobacter kobayashii]GCE23772.1 haloacid dehalogenase [Dictyobacter kobayashii]
MAPICVFDVNETLLDLHALDPLFEQAFGNGTLRRNWFTQMLQNAFVSTIAGPYQDFGTLGASALDMLSEQQKVTLSAHKRSAILDTMRQLPAHSEVPKSLERLQHAGLHMVTLTNSTQQVATLQITNAGLVQYFEQIFSADTVQRLKPAPEPYQMVATHFGVPTSELLLIAAHAWDVAGASRAGCATAFVARPGMVLNPLFPTPTIIGHDLSEVVDHILKL